MAKNKNVRNVDLDKEVVLDSKGNRITEADAEAIAEATLRRVGRPSLTGSREESPRVAFRVSPKLAQRVDTVAQKRGVTRSALAREALEKYVS
jgi:hypothetical protein